MNIFISWSGKFSKKIASAIKEELLAILGNGNINVFMSEQDIMSGEYWLEKIKNNLSEANVAILCITKENVSKPWILFESGAMSLNKNSAKIIPLLFNVKIDSNSPLSVFERVDFNKDNYNKLLYDLKSFGKITSISQNQFKRLIKDSFDELSNKISPELESLKNIYFDSEIEVYPSDKTILKKRCLFISSPMASIKKEQYPEFRNNVISVKQSIEKYCDFSEIFYPGEEIPCQDNFDGDLKAIEVNFSRLKECEYMLVIYPRKLSSSSLLEIGYGIALSKKIVVFCPKREVFPYMFQSADKKINNINIIEYKNINEICQTIKKNGMTLFNG